MSYATIADLVAEFGDAEIIDLTDRATPRAHAIDNAVAQRALDRADAEIDAAVGTRYPLPLAQVPQLLRYLACDLARYYLYDRAEPPTAVEARWKAAQASLKALASGGLDLGADATGVLVSAQPSALPDFPSSQKDFGRGNW